MTGPWLVAFVALWVMVMLLAVLVIGLLRRLEVVLTQAEARDAITVSGPRVGLLPGELMPSFAAKTSTGQTVTSKEALPQVPFALLFVEPGCPPCEQMVKDLKITGWGADAPLVLVTGDDPSTHDWLAECESATVLFQLDQSASAAFASTVTPNAFLLSAHRVVAQIVPVSLAALRSWAIAVASREKEVVPIGNA